MSGPAMKMLYTTLLLGGLFSAQTLPAGESQAAADCSELSGRTIRWIVPSRPGGGYDTYSRLLEPFLERELNARLVLENRPEAGGLVAAMALRDAAPDGTTIGIINAAGLVTRSLLSGATVPDPRVDLTLLGRVMGAHFALFSGRDSGISSIYQLLQPSHSGPVVVSVRDISSASFLALPVTASLIGMDIALVTGYDGNAERSMSIIRGEVDITVSNFDSARHFVDAGEFVPLLQVSESAQVHLPDLPSLTGPQGLARRRAEATGRTADQAEREAAALARILSLGRVVAAPAGLPAPIAGCLDSRLHKILHSAELHEAALRARLSIDPADRDVINEDLRIATGELQQFEALLRAAIR